MNKDCGDAKAGMKIDPVEQIPMDPKILDIALEYLKCRSDMENQERKVFVELLEKSSTPLFLVHSKEVGREQDQ